MYKFGFDRPGTVYWFTGLSGAGKTTIGSLFFKKLREHEKHSVYLDGDILREVFGGQHGHTRGERKLLAMNYSHLCKMLSDQGLDVVIATISMFHDVRDWNRENIERYREVYIKVPIEVLIDRDQKGLYSQVLKGGIQHIMGIDVAAEEPENPDCVVVNDGSGEPLDVVGWLWDEIGPTA